MDLKPIKDTGSPFFKESVIVAIVASKTRPESALVKFDDSAIALISSDLFIL